MQLKKSTKAGDRGLRPLTDSVERTLQVVGDRWIFLLLREAFFGVRRFDEFVANTGGARNILAGRLKRLVDDGIFRKELYGGGKSRFEYRLTEKGRDLYPLIVLMMQWGDRWLDDGSGPPLRLIHQPCGGTLGARLVCTTCGGEIDARETTWQPWAEQKR